jgi:uncharacterized protein (TIGR03085 family)
MTASFARDERSALVQLLRQTGPDAATLCTGWTTFDLAAHLVTRERQPLAGPGLLITRLHPLTAALERRAQRRGYDTLLDQIDAGPPRWTPAAWSPRLDSAMNLAEFFVHHEDVRRLREQTPRRLPEGESDALARTARTVARLIARRARARLTLAPAGRETRTVGRGQREATVHGEVGEIVLWLFGRHSAAQVSVDGDAAKLVEEATL